MDGFSLAIRTRDVFKNIENAIRKSKRQHGDVLLVAVSKGHTSDVIRQAKALGLSDFGENYVQEWNEKSELLKDLSLKWHFIGNLQSNKVKNIIGKVDWIHSLDRPQLFSEIARRAREQNCRQKVLIEVNFSGEKSKAGLAPNEVFELLKSWSLEPSIILDGIAVMPPLVAESEHSRPWFQEALRFWKECKPRVQGHSWSHLSMGTSQDYQVAIEEGATIVRVGTEIFGPRNKNQGNM